MATLEYSSDEIYRKARKAFEAKDYKKAKILDGMYQKAYAAEEANAKDGAFEGFGDAFMRGIDQAAENTATTARVFGKDDLADSLGGLVDRRPGQSAASQFMNEGRPIYDFTYAPKAVAEQAGQFIGSLGSRAGGAAVGAGVGGLAGSVIPGAGTAAGAATGGVIGAFGGPMVFEGMQQLGPIAMERAKNNGRKEPNKEDFYVAATSAAGIGMLNAIAPGMSGIMRRMLAEGGTEALQSVGEQTGSTLLTKKGLEVSPRQAIGEGIIGAGSAGAVDTTIAGARKAVGSRTRGQSSAEDLMKGYQEEFPTSRTEQAAADLSKRLALKIDQADEDENSENYDVQDVDPDNNKGAKGLIDNSHSDMNQRLKTLIGMLKERLKIKKSDTFDQVIEKSDAALAAIKSKNKVKNVVEPADFAAFEKIAGDTQEGQEAISLMHEMNALTNLYSGGLTGGVTQYTDALNPIGPLDNYSNTGGPMQQFARPLASIALGLSNPALSAAQIGTFGAGRLIDKATGRRSNVARYIDQNVNQPGQPAATGRSLKNEEAAEEAAKAQVAEQALAQAEEARLRQEQYTEEERQANLRRVQQSAPPQQGSPEDIMRDATGLDRSGLAQVIRILKANPNTLPATTRAIEAYETSVATGGQVDFGLYRDINALVDQYPQLQNLMVRPRNAQSAAQGQAQQQLSQKDQNYQRGIENNRAEAARITEAVNADSTIPVQQKAMLLNTLEEMQLDLGLNPVSRLQSMARRLEEQDVPGPTVEKYLGQYLQRVMAQQGAKEERDAAQDDAMEIDESREMSFNRNNVADRKARAEEQGYDTSTVYYHGTASNILSFEKGKRGLSTGSTSAENGFWFSDSPRTAMSYAHYSGTYAPVHNLVKEAEDAASVYGDELIEQETMLTLDGLLTQSGIDSTGFKKDSNGIPISVIGHDAYDKLLDAAEKLELKFNSGDRNNGQNIIPIYAPKDADLLVKDMEGKSFDDSGVSLEINDLMRKAKLTGKKGVKLLNLNDSVGLADDPSTHLAIFEPSDIRSVNAQFDPLQTNSLELNASMEPSFTDGPALAFDTSPNVNAINEGSETFPKMKGKTEVAKFLEARALNKIGGTVRDIADPADRELIANDLVAEAIYEMNSQDEGSAMDWYDLTIEKMLSMMSLKYPEIATDVNAKTPMLVALSIMSQNMDVPTNLKIAEKAYEYFRDKGQFEVIGQGKSQAVMELNFKKANMLLNKLGSMEALADFLQTKFTVKELNPVLQNYLGDEGKVGGENVDTVVYGSAVFGPKVGNGFYTNLRGDFSPVTMDMWFMRTVGRLKGKLMEFDEKKFQNQLNRLKKALGRKRISKEQLIDKAFELIKLHEADYKKNRKLYDLKKGDPKRKVKSEATKAAFTIKGSLKNTIDSPTNGTERNHLRSLVQTAVTKFNQQTGLSIEPAAFQALIWYPEQDLYKKLGVPLKNVRKDFATSLKELLIKEGFNEQDLNAAIDRVQPRPKLGPGEVRQSTVVPEQRTVRNADEQPSRTLQPEEITAEIDLSTQPALLQPESPQIPFDFTTPTVGQIKDKLEDAKGAVQMVIGKPGTKFEKGLSSMEDFQQLADMLDISIGIFQTHKELRDFSQNNIPIGTEGFFQPNNEGVSGRVAIRNRSNYGKTLLTLAHEMSHGLESRPMDNEPSYTIKRPPAHNLADKKQKQYFDGSLRQSIAQVVAAAQRNYLPDSTFAEKLPDAKIRMNYANDIVSNLTYSQAKSIKDEIDALQNGTFVGFGSAPELGEFPIRLNRKLAKELYFEQNPSATDEEANRRVDEEFLKYEGYIKNDAEFSEDPVLLSIIDPKTSKKLLPTTYKFIQDHFNESNIPVKFFASPLATIVAILMAGMIGGEEEENPGILTPGPGMLSA